MQCSNVVIRLANSFSSKICERAWHVSVRMVKLRHTCIFTCLKVFSNKHEAAYNLCHINFSLTLCQWGGEVWHHVSMVIIFLDLNKIFFFRDDYFLLLNNGRKVSATVWFLSAIMHKKCNYAQEIHTFQFFCLPGSYNLEKVWNVGSHLEKS